MRTFVDKLALKDQPDNIRIHLELVYYKDGTRATNYQRGYYLSVSKVETKNHDGFLSECYTPTNGTLSFVEPCTRLNQSKMVELAHTLAMTPSRTAPFVNRVCELEQVELLTPQVELQPA